MGTEPSDTEAVVQAHLKAFVRQMGVEGEVAYITWSVGDYAPLGMDTFVVRNGKIVSQTFAMHPPAAA
ncbi:MAG TPA: hypothetical protein VLU54_09600 [Casimicrobiaceae bacterium]|nr:hypothetical protein [Casimicrobiaceae bacterium]